MLAACLLLATGAATAQSGHAAWIADEGTLGAQWQLAGDAPLATAAYPVHLAAGGDDACIALGYVVEADGRTSGFRVLRQWSSAGDPAGKGDDYWAAFAEAAAAAVAQWRFAPRPGVDAPRAAQTVATIAFLASPGSDPGGVRGQCAIADLAAHLRALDDRGRLALERQRAMERQRADSAWHRRERQMSPESTVDTGSNRPVHRW